MEQNNKIKSEIEIIFEESQNSLEKVNTFTTHENIYKEVILYI